MKRLKLALIAIFAMIMLFTLPFAVACNDASDNTPDNSANTDDKDKDNTDNQDKDPDKEPDGDKDDDGDDPDKGGDEDPTAKRIWAGSWKSLDGTSAFTVSEDATAVTVGNAAAADVTCTGDALSFTAGDTTYALTWYDGLVGGKIAVLTEGSKTSYYIPDAAAEIGDDFNGTWYDLLDTNTLTIDAEAGTAAFNGETAVAVVDCGVVETLENNDGSTANVDHQCLYLIMENGDIIFVGWYKDSTSAGQANGRAFNCPEVTIPETSETPLTHRPFVELYVDEDLDGTWTNVNAGGSISIEIDAEAKTAKVGGTAVEIYNNGGTRGAGNIIVVGGTKYRLEPDPGYNYYLTRETVVDLGMGQRDFFLKSDHEPQKVTNTRLLNSEWKDASRQNTLRIDGDGNVFFNNTLYVIYVAGLVEGTTNYKVIAFSADNKTADIVYDGSKIEFSDGILKHQYTSSAQSTTEEVGFLGLPMGTATNAEGKSIIVNKDSLVIRSHTFDFWDDSDITLTMDMLHKEDTPLDNSSAHYTYTWTSVTFEKEQVIHIALDVDVHDLSGETKTVKRYQLMVVFGENAENPFFQIGDALPDVTFSPTSVKAFDDLFLGTWVSETGDDVFIGEKVLGYKGRAVTEVTCKGSDNSISYDFVIDGVHYSMAWAWSNYTASYVLDVLNVDSGEREDFMFSGLDAATVSATYYGRWTATDEGQSYTITIDENGIVYNGETVGKIVDGGYHPTTEDGLGGLINENIYFFLSDGIVHLLIWNDTLKCPTVLFGNSEIIFDNAPAAQTDFPEALRGAWVSSAGKTIEVTATTFKINGKDVSAHTFKAAIVFTEDGKEKTLSVNDGTTYVIKVVTETLGSDGIATAWTTEYYYKTDRPAVTVDPSLNGTWTNAADKDDALTIENGVIKWGDKTATLIEAGEARTDGFVYFVDFDGTLYELFAYSTDDTWTIELSGSQQVDSFTKNS